MLNPFLLWFVPLAAIPILLHLITLYRLRTVELSTFRFLMEGYVKQRQRLKLLEWLLMVLRTAFVLLIVVMLSRPVVERYGYLFGGNLSRDVTLIVDAGATLSLKSAGSTSMQRAREAARVIVGKLTPSDHVELILAGREPRVLFDGFAAKPQPLLDVIDTIEPDLTVADLPAALTQTLGRKPHGPRIIYLLTDGRKRTFTAMSGHPVRRQLDARTHMVVLNVGPTDRVTNLSLAGDPPRTGRPVAGLPVDLTATIIAAPNAQALDTRLTVTLDGQQVAQSPLTLQPGQTLSRSFSVTPTRAGVIRGRFELSGDDFADDDGYNFTLNVEPQINVLLVTGPPPGTPSQAPRLFITTALRSPLLVRGETQTQEKQIAQSLNLSVVQQHQLAPNVLKDADVVILADVAMQPHWGLMLRDYVQQGGGLLVFPGPQVNPQHYTAWLFAPPAQRGAPPPGPSLRFAEPIGDPEDEQTFQPISIADLSHPVLSVFDERGRDYFTTARLYRYYPIEPPQAAAGGAGSVAVLMRTVSRDAVLVQTRWGRGHIMVAGFAATANWSNVPLKAEFVPLLLRAVSQLRRASPIVVVNAVRPHEPARIQLGDDWDGAGVEAITPDGRPHAIELHRSDDQVVGALLQTDKAGYYTFHVTPPASAGGQEQTRQLGFAVNLDAEQLDFQPVQQQQVADAISPAQLTYLVGSPDDPVLIERLSHKREVWRMLIWAMCAVIGVEFLLSTLRPIDLSEMTGGSGGRLRRWVGQIEQTVDRSVGLAEPVEQDAHV